MSEYIEKNYLLAFLDAVIETEEDQNKRIFAKAIKMTIGTMPPFNVKEWKTGYWFDKGSMSCRCSNCGCKSTHEYDFCPICGADMRGEKCGLQPLKMFEKCGYPKEGERREDDQDI